MLKPFPYAVATAMCLLTANAYAQKHDHAHPAPNGGQIRMIGAFEAELAVKGSELALYIVDDKERKVDASKFSAAAVVLAQGNVQKTVELKPAGENKLAATMDFKFEGKFRATVALRSSTAELGKARYSFDPPR